MTRIAEYHRPSTISDALALLNRSDVATAPLAGGTTLNAPTGNGPDAVVDLQDLTLDTITRDGATLTFGATARLQAIVDHEWTPPALRDLAHGEAPNTFRNAATIGGTVATADPESRLLAGFLAYGAVATLTGPAGSEKVLVANLLADRKELNGRLIVAVSIELGGVGASAGTARTPADTPIVLVAGRRSEDGAIKLAATGVAATPIEITPEALDSLDPPGDFRGSPQYRRHLAKVLCARVLAQLEDAE
jgi:CO/xanthine dehydrogenase FAD-binding subunit